MTVTKIGILGAGQLGRMLALAGYPLGFQFRFLDHSAEAPAGQVGPMQVGEFEDQTVLDAFAQGLDVVTFEFENVPVHAVEHLAKSVAVYPSAQALEVTQDRLAEKLFLQELGIQTAPIRPVASSDEISSAVAELGTPAILKTRRFGYDGKGQFRLSTSSQVAEAWEAIAGAPAIIEGYVNFDRELSLLSVRSTTGETAFYPLVENTHSHGILKRSVAPAPAVGPELQSAAEEIATKVLRSLNYVGVLAIEFFEVRGRLIVNEMAPRVHNSGHWSIEGAVTSQFENHLRAIVGLPLGPTAVRGESLMLNCIGKMPDVASVLQIGGAHLHDYGKSPRKGRKVGHVTLCGVDSPTAEESGKCLERLLNLH